MTLYTLVNILKQIALTQPNVKSATDGSIYEIMNATNSVKYDVVHLSQTKHITDEETDTYGFNIFYVSRLEDSLEDNRLQIQSIGKEVLDNILRTFCENWNIDYPEIIFYPFTQKFADLCAGVYCKVEIEIPKEIICADDYIDEVTPRKGIKLENIVVEVDENGTRIVTPSPGFDGIGKVTIVTDVTGGSCNLEYKEVEYTENGEYTIVPSSGYDGLSEVAVTVDVPSRYNEGYADGAADQKAKLTVTSLTENNTYTREDGWSAVTVNVPSDYQDGYSDGEAAQKAKLVATSFTENSAYTREDGYSAVTVDVPSRYNEGYADGEAAQKAKLSSTSVTENGTYTREDGYSAFTVDVDTVNNQSKTYTFNKNNTQIVQSVGGDYYLYGGEIIRPDSGYTGLDKATISLQANIQDLYDSGYTNGYDDGVAHQKSLLASTSFTENGVYTRENGWNEVSVDVETGKHSVVFDFSESEDLSGLTGNAIVTITSIYGTTNYTYTGSNITVLLLPGVRYEFSFSSVSGYSEPATMELTTVWSGNTTIYVVYDKETQKDYLTLAIKDNGIVRFDPNSDGRDGKSYDYKINGTSWVKNLNSLTEITVSEGDIIQFRGDNLSYRNGDSNFMGFYGTTCSFDVYGNVMSLYDKNDFEEITTIPYGHSFRGLFYDCRGLISAADLELPATTLGQSCYRHMFANCDSLTSAPALPATTLASYCYSHMFINCTSLTEAPELTATVLPIYAYYSMFNGCTSLNYIKCLATDISAENCTTNWVGNVASAGTFVRATHMTDWITGYNGIPDGWTAITDYTLRPLTFNIISGGTISWVTPNGSQKTIQYSLDNGTTWSSITSSESGSTFNVNDGDKVIFKGDNATYDVSEFYGTTAVFEVEGNIMSLIDSTGYTTATTLTSPYTFQYIFLGCTGLTSAENLILPATTLTESCYYGMFTNCTLLTTAPELPATTLAVSCYYEMFFNCESLTTAPELPATTLINYCYVDMFYGCSTLNYIKCLATDISAFGCTVGWTYGVASAGTFVKDPNMTGWTVGMAGIPDNWTIIDNT